MASYSKRWALAYLRGLAQVAFSESPWAGLLVIGSIVLLAPWSALGAVAGGLVGLVAGRYQKSLSEAQWEAGLAGFNPAIVGILWGLTYAAGETGLGALALLLGGSIAIEYVMRPVLARAELPLMSMPAMVTAYLATAVFATFDATFWQHAAPPVLGNFGLALAAVMIVAALATQSIRATVLTVAVVAAVYVAAWLPGLTLLGSQGLWGFTVAPAVFGIFGVFLAGSNRGALAALFGGALSTLLWTLWVNTPLQSMVPPSLVPFILGTWITLGVFARLSRGAGSRARAGGDDDSMTGLPQGPATINVPLD